MKVEHWSGFGCLENRLHGKNNGKVWGCLDEKILYHLDFNENYILFFI